MDNSKQAAFPDPKRSASDLYYNFSEGLTKREWFAGLAMQALISGKWASPDYSNTSPDEIAPIALRHADALLSELEKQNPSNEAQGSTTQSEPTNS